MAARQDIKGPIQVIDRMMKLLDVLGEHPEPLGLKQLAQYAGLHPSTAHRILTAMAGGRLVDRVERAVRLHLLQGQVHALHERTVRLEGHGEILLGLRLELADDHAARDLHGGDEEGARQVDLRAVWESLAYRYVPGPKTLFAGIRKLPPATYGLWQFGRLRESR